MWRLAAFALTTALTARTAPAQSLGLTPAEIRAAFRPQQVLQFELHVSNEGDAPVTMRGSVTDLWFDPATNEKVFAAPGTLPRSAANWVTFVPATFTVSPHGTATVKALITPPPEATGGAYAVLFFESKPEATHDPSSPGRAVYANVRLGALLLLNASGTEDYRIAVTDTALTPPDAHRNLELSFQLLNAGNTHIFPEARLTIVNGRKQVVARAEADVKRFFPGQKDSIRLTWSGSLPAGEYTCVLTVTYGNDKVHTETMPLRVGQPGESPAE
jgi:hypothetical protein